MVKNKTKCASPEIEKMVAFFIEYTPYVRKDLKPQFSKPSISSYGWSEVYAEPCQTSKMEIFVRQVNDRKTLTIFAKRFILDS